MIRMEYNKSLEEEIDRYLEGDMTKEEKDSFNERMRKDPDLVKEVELQGSIIRAIRNERISAIIQYEEVRIHKQKRIRTLVISVGSFAIAASLFGIIFYSSYLNNCSSLSDRYYVAYNYTPTPSRSGQLPQLTRADSMFFYALLEFEKKNIKVTIKQLESLNNSNAQMTAASGQAIKWYLALAYLKNGEKKKARLLLQEIATKPHSEFAVKAGKLLKEL